MRRPEKQIHDPAQIEAILDEAAVIRLALNDDGAPYIVPLCFARLESVLYCHSASKGRKLDLIARDRRVGFEAETGVAVVPGEIPCKFGVTFRSVVGSGEASLVMDPDEKRLGLDRLSEKYAGFRPADYPGPVLERTQVIRVIILQMTGKASGTCGYPF